DRLSGLRSGWAEAQPDAGSFTPSGTSILQWRISGNLVTEAAVPATLPTTSARLFVENAAATTGLALANTTDSSEALNFQLRDLTGNMGAATTQTLQPRSHMSIDARELFPGLKEGFSGVVEISSPTAFAARSVKLTNNSRNELF